MVACLKVVLPYGATQNSNVGHHVLMLLPLLGRKSSAVLGKIVIIIIIIIPVASSWSIGHP